MNVKKRGTLLYVLPHQPTPKKLQFRTPQLAESHHDIPYKAGCKVSKRIQKTGQTHNS